MAIVSVNFIELVFGKILNIKKSLNVHILMRENHRGVSVCIAWSFLVVDLEVFILLVFINTEEEV